jgi:outer membrane receptor for ferrienterochelin and colicins
MKRIYLLGLLFLSIFTCSLTAQQERGTASIRGHILDKKTQKHINNISIIVKGTTIGTVADGTGHYTLKNLPAGKTIIVAKGLGYEAVEQEIELQDNMTVEVNFEVEEKNTLIEGIVVSSSRIETNRKEATTVVGVISPLMFEMTNSNNLAQGLNFQSGLRVETSCQNCGFQQVRINGLEGQYTQILMDSRPVFSSLAGVYGIEQIPANMIDRVEIIRGGGSAIFGANAVGGVVNIITKEPISNLLSVSNNTNLIGGDAWENNTALNASLISEDFKMGTYIFGMNKQRQAYDADGDGFSEIGKINAQTLGFRTYYKFNDRSKVTAQYHFINEYRRGGDNLDRPPHEAEVAEQTEHKINGGNLEYSLYSKNYKHRLSVYSSLQRIDRDSYYGTNMDPDAYGKSKDITSVSGVQYGYIFDRLFFMPSEFMAGVEYNYNHLTDLMLGYNRELDQEVYISGAFLQNEWKNEKASILLGIRADKHNLIDDIIASPRLNFRYAFNPDIAFRMSYSSGFRAPQAFDEDLHIMAVGGNVSFIDLAPDLQPERSHSFSASFDLYKNFGSVRTNLLIEGFYTKLNDVFYLHEKEESDEFGNLLLERRNGPGAYVAGINAELRLLLNSDWQVNMGYTYQQSRYKEAIT